MVQSTATLTNFSAGEWSPRLLGRSDLAKYFNALQRCQNWVCQRHGGLIRRSGTRYVAAARYNNKTVRLIPFQYSTTQTYILEFGDLYIRFYKNRGQLLSGGSPYTIVSPWTAAQLAELQFTQSADVLYVCHPDVAARQVNRLGDTNWNITTFANFDGPYLSENTTTTTMTPSALTGSVTITASAVTGINNDTGFQSTDVGRLFWYEQNGEAGFGEITAVADTTHCTVLVNTAQPNGAKLHGTSAEKSWRLGAWSATTGYPWTAVFHHERLWFGGTDTSPQSIWGSAVGDFVNFRPQTMTNGGDVVNDDDGVSFTISDDQVNAIRWMRSGARGLMIGTEGGTFIAGASSPFDPITPSNISIRRQVTFGSHATARPIQLGSTVLFPERGGRKLYQFGFNFEEDQYVAQDITLAAEHVTRSTSGGIVETAFQHEPLSVAWAVRGDGALLGLTYLREEEVVAWHRHILGGNFDGGNPVVESIATIRDSTSNNDLLWLVVKRTVNGGTVRYIEFIEDEFDGDDKQDAFFVDCGLTYDGVPASTITGLTHLEGQTVDVLADGAVHPSETVSGGSITLDYNASTVQVGLPYTSDAITMPLVPPAGFDSRGKLLRPYRATFLFHDTLGLQAGQNGKTLFDVAFRDGDDPMDASAPLFTGAKHIPIESGSERQPALRFRQTQPLPATVLSAIIEMEVGGV